MENQAESTSPGSGEGGDGNSDTPLKDPSNPPSLMDIEATEEGGGEKLATSVFGNHLLVDLIMSYLDHTSIKFLSQTCQMLLGIVRGNPDFLRRTKINISSPSFQFANFPWKNVTIVDLSLGSYAQHRAILPQLSQVESLEIYNKIDQLPDSEQVVRLVGFLSAAESMKKLVIGLEISVTFDPNLLTNIVRDVVKAKLNLQKLESLRIIAGRPCFDHPKGSNFFHSILALAVEFPTCLTSFTLEGRLGVGRRQAVMAVVAILKKHKGTIRSLSLSCGNIYFMMVEQETMDPGLSSIVFPALKDLHFQAPGSQLRKVSLWLANQPPLESLSLKFAGEPVMDSLPLLNPLLIHGSTLKKFALAWTLNEMAPQLRQLPAPWDFSFLQTCESLRELKIRHESVTNSRFGVPLRNVAPRSSLGSILAAIPDGIKIINLSGGVYEENKDFRGIPVSKKTIESLERFRNLSVLNLIKCVSFLDDEILSFICTNMTQLKEFGFSHCNGVTDAGLIGKHEKSCSVPGIRALRGLGTLRIMCCPYVTPYGFLTAISFLELRFLSLIIEKRVPPSFYQKLAAQNRSLEVLEVHHWQSMQNPRNDDETNVLVASGLEEALKHESPRFRTLKFKTPPFSGHEFVPNLDSDDPAPDFD